MGLPVTGCDQPGQRLVLGRIRDHCHAGAGALTGAGADTDRRPQADAAPTQTPTVATPKPTPKPTPTPTAAPKPTPTTQTPTVAPKPTPTTQTPTVAPKPTPTTHARPPAPAPGGKPSAGTTGVPGGHPAAPALRRHHGDPGRHGAEWDGYPWLRHRARGECQDRRTRSSAAARPRATATGLITNYGYSNLLVEDVDVVAEHPSVYFDGIKGNNFTARRVHVVGNVDSIKIHGDNVKVENSLLENTVHYASDPYQGGGPSHNDNIQILSGRQISITGNTIRGAQQLRDPGIVRHTPRSPTCMISKNWVDGGHCTIKLQVLNGWSQTSTVIDNKFGPNRKVQSCPFVAYPADQPDGAGQRLRGGRLAGEGPARRGHTGTAGYARSSSTSRVPVVRNPAGIQEQPGGGLQGHHVIGAVVLQQDDQVGRRNLGRQVGDSASRRDTPVIQHSGS